MARYFTRQILFVRNGFNRIYEIEKNKFFMSLVEVEPDLFINGHWSRASAENNRKKMGPTMSFDYVRIDIHFVHNTIQAFNLARITHNESTSERQKIERNHTNIKIV
jgi:hypothetical protein